MKAFDLQQVKLKKTSIQADHSVPKLKADVEGLSSDHDQVFMSFNIEHWYPVIGPSKTSATTFYPIPRPVAQEIISLHTSLVAGVLPKKSLRTIVRAMQIFQTMAAELQKLIAPKGSFIKTSARSSKDVALETGLLNYYRGLLLDEISRHGIKINEMKLRTLFMHSGRQVLRFITAESFLIACILSNRICGDIERGLRDNLNQPLSFVIREWMPICPPEYEFRCFVTKGRLTGISQYISTIYSPFVAYRASSIRTCLSNYFETEIKGPLAGLYDRYAVDIVLLNPEEGKQDWKFWVIEVNPWFELTGEGLFESEVGRRILEGEMEGVEYPVMRVQEMKIVDGTEKELLNARRKVEMELGVVVV